MTETKTKEFTPITTQEQFDEAIKGRLAREKEKWEKQTGTEDLRAQLASKDEEISEIRREHYLEDTKRALMAELASRGVTDEGRIERIMRHVDLGEIEATEGGRPSREHLLGQLDGVSRDLPELLRPRGAGSRGSHRPVVETEKPLTREEVEAMSPAEQAKPGMRERIDRFLAGQRS
jgi:hypothetical protein